MLFRKPRDRAAPPIGAVLGEKLVRCFNDPGTYGVHQLFNDWWPHAPDDVIAAYAEDFEADNLQKAFYADKHLAAKTSMAELAAFPSGTLGRGFHNFIADNGLEENIARNYKVLHNAMRLSGKLRSMPDPLRYQVIRGFQLHDLLHVLTGYEATGPGEIALQAFCLAQIRFPYFAMWMSVTTTRMALVEPDAIVPMMNAITDGWTYGRRAENIQFVRWEEHFARPIGDIRAEYGLERESAFDPAA